MIRIPSALLLISLMIASLAGMGPAQADGDTRALPRYSAIGSGKAHLRIGPGQQYPILWVLRRRGLPIYILDAYADWYHVELWDGERGWISNRLVGGRRTLMVTDETVPLHRDPRPDSRIVARLANTVILTIERCRPGWCEVATRDGATGWVARAGVFGVGDDEVID